MSFGCSFSLAVCVLIITKIECEAVLNIDLVGIKHKVSFLVITCRVSEPLHFRYGRGRTKLEPLEPGRERHLLLSSGGVLEAIQAIRAVPSESDVLLDQELLPQLEVQVQQRVQAGAEAQREQESPETEQELRELGKDARGRDRAD